MQNLTITAGIVGTDTRHLVTSQGLAITSFRLAQHVPAAPATEDLAAQPESFNWFTVTSYRSLALNVKESIHRGDRVIVVGTMKVRDWDDGLNTGTLVELNAETIGHDLNFCATAATRTPAKSPTQSQGE